MWSLLLNTEVTYKILKNRVCYTCTEIQAARLEVLRILVEPQHPQEQLRNLYTQFPVLLFHRKGRQTAFYKNLKKICKHGDRHKELVKYGQCNF